MEQLGRHKTPRRFSELPLHSVIAREFRREIGAQNANF